MHALTRKKRAILRERRAFARRLHWLEVHMHTCERGTQCMALGFVRLALTGHVGRAGSVNW